MQRVHLGLLATTVLISACGGDGDGSFGGQTPVSSSFPITANNGVETTRLSYQAALASGSFAELGALPVAAAPGDGFEIAAHVPTTEDLLLDVINHVPFGPDEQECLGGGSLFLSGDIADPLGGTLTPGDTFEFEYVNCNDGADSVINGIIYLEVTDFSGDYPDAFMLAVDVEVASLNVVTPSENVTGDGDASITIDTTQMLIAATSVSGTSMSQSSNGVSQTLTNYGSATTVDANQQPEEYTMDAYGTLEHSSLPGSVDYSTSAVFRGLVPAYPYEGVFFVQGDNSAARLTVLDDSNVRVEIDVDGDGVMDHSEDLTWDEFLGNNT